MTRDRRLDRRRPARTDAPGGRLTVPNPADLSQTRGGGARSATPPRSSRPAGPREAAQPGWAAVPAPVRGRAIQQLGRLVEDEQGGARPARHARDRQADRRVARRGAGGRRHLQLLPRRGPAPLRPDRADARCPTSSCSRSATPVGVAAIVTAGNFPVAVPSWYLVPALLCGNAVVWKPAEYAPATAEAFAQLFLHAGLPGRRAQPGARRRARRRSPGSSARSSEGLVDKVGFTGSTDGRARGSASSAGATCSRRASSSAARTRSS